MSSLKPVRPKASSLRRPSAALKRTAKAARRGSPDESPKRSAEQTSADAHRIAAAIERGIADGRLDVVSADALQAVIAAASRLYTADFIGAFLGALLACTLLIPLIGVGGVCLLTALLNLAGGLACGQRKAAA